MQKQKRKKPERRFPFYFFLAVMPFIAFAILVPTIDADRYRPQVAALLAEALGRDVTLNGPISFSAGFGGIKISVEDADIANVQPASRPVMAHIGRLELGMATPLLMRGLLPIRDLSLYNADILVESSLSETQAARPVSQPAWALFHSLRLSLGVHSIKIADSRVAFLKDGKQAALNVSSFLLKMTKDGAVLNLNGSASDTPIVADIKTTMKDITSPASFSIDAAGTYGDYYWGALGKVDPVESRADLNAYEVTTRGTKMTGELDVTWASGRPILHGTINSDYLNIADFAGGSGEEGTGPKESVFSTKALHVGALHDVDADIALNAGRVPVGKGSLEEVHARLTLLGGNLTLAPIKALLGGTPVDLRVVVDASRAPAHFDVGMIAHGADFAALQRLAGLSPFVTGKAGAYIRLGGSGDTPHDIAASLAGVVSVSVEKGAVSASLLSEASSLLASVFTSGGNDTALNCLAARFIVRDGIVTSNGILIDSPISTIGGQGRVDLGAETTDFVWRARPKAVGLVGLIPVLRVKGPMKTPLYSVNARSIMKHVVNSIIDADGYGIDSVPPLNAPAGENACIYTLEHPKKTSSTTILRADPLGKIENLGKSLIGGLFNE
ncbi:MAG: AsmA family protein [Alphaproteobacteria bacterium]|nr:AsmA family protein [Alphaproteobacteria bacterium]